MAQTQTKSKRNSSTAKSSNGNSGRSKRSSNASAGSKENQSTLLEELFLEELKDIYWAEKHLLKDCYRGSNEKAIS